MSPFGRVRIPGVLLHISCAVLVGLCASCERQPAGNGGGENAGTDASLNVPEGHPDSDEKANILAAQMLEAVGGREAWDDVRYIHFEYFNGRRHTWDKEKNLVRIDMPSPIDRPSGALINLETGDFQAWEGGQPVADEGRLEMIRSRALPMWRNDSFWMYMPFRLFEDGIALQYIGEGTTSEGEPAEMIAVVTRGVSTLTMGRYVIYIDPETKLPVQWDTYSEETSVEPALSTVWTGWQEIDGLKFSTDRGEVRNQLIKLSDVTIFDELPETVFTEFVPLPEQIRELIEN